MPTGKERADRWVEAAVNVPRYEVHRDRDPNAVTDHRRGGVFPLGSSRRKEPHLEQTHTDKHHAENIPAVPVIELDALRLAGERSADWEPAPVAFPAAAHRFSNILRCGFDVSGFLFPLLSRLARFGRWFYAGRSNGPWRPIS